MGELIKRGGRGQDFLKNSFIQVGHNKMLLGVKNFKKYNLTSPTIKHRRVPALLIFCFALNSMLFVSSSLKWMLTFAQILLSFIDVFVLVIRVICIQEKSQSTTCFISFTSNKNNKGPSSTPQSCTPHFSSTRIFVCDIYLKTSI